MCPPGILHPEFPSSLLPQREPVNGKQAVDGSGSSARKLLQRSIELIKNTLELF
jgi:hypothetical protein